MPFLNNAEASSSKQTSTNRKKSTKTKKDGLKRIMSNGSGNATSGPGPNNTRIPFASPLSPPVPGAGPSERRVRTRPPCAAFEPPTPPSPPPLPAQDISPATPRRPRPRLRYSTSDDTDESGSSDDEVPWWTFTNRGMMKLRQRQGGRRKSDVGIGEGESAVESGKEEPKRTRRHFISSRRSSKNDDSAGSGKESRPKPKPQRIDSSPQKSSPLTLGPRLFAPAPIRSLSSYAPDLHLWRKPSGGHTTPDEVQSDTDIPRRRIFHRSNSAPGSPLPPSLDPIVDSPHPLASLIIPNQISAEPVPIQPVESDPVIARHVRAKRQMTAPSFPRLRKLRSDRLGPTDNVSDSEAVRTQPRLTIRSRMHSSAPNRPRSTPGPIETTGESPGAPRPRRLNSSMLKLQLPEPISQHFAHGWPHAGSWQDALYGYYDGEEGNQGRPRQRRENTIAAGMQDMRERERSGETLVQRNSQENGVNPKSPDLETPRTGRKRARRSRRYRQALMPPTPKGLGFTPRDGSPDNRGVRWKEGKVGQTEFDWSLPHTATDETHRHAPQATGSTIPEGDELSRTQTRMTDIVVEKIQRQKKKRKVIQTGRTKRQGEDWKVRWKRMMFLDARLTIFLRVLEIAVVAILLALSITIRQELIGLRLPGLIGPSTILTISFASFTLFHAFTAIYREYFGKPIGLWGLRSKMLWVCLDLLFVALWSSALSLSTNDYISTPLECTRDDPWWIPGLRSSYTSLLSDLSATGTLDQVTGADLIKATLGIILPEQIIQAPLAREVCRRQSGCIALSLLALLLYAGNMVLSLFRIFETVRRSSDVGKAIMV